MKRKNCHDNEHKTPKLAQWVQAIHVPSAKIRFKSIGNKQISFLFVAPMGFATAMLATTNTDA